MGEYDEAGYYELQLNNKQLVFFFMAAVAIAVVVFLCGVMVGRGVRDAAIAASPTASIVAGREAASPAERDATPVEVRSELDYQSRLESPQVDDRLEAVSSSPEDLAAAATKISAPPSQASGPQPPPPAEPKPETSSGAKAPSITPPSSGPRAASANLLGAETGGFTIQVVALKTADAAGELVSRLQAKGYRAYVESEAAAGLYRVRVGRFATRVDAEKVAERLRDSEKFKPYITQ